jgi:hypothetical protein
LEIFSKPNCKIFIVIRSTLRGKYLHYLNLSESSVDFLDIISLIFSRSGLLFNIIINDSDESQPHGELGRLFDTLARVPVHHNRNLASWEKEEKYQRYCPLLNRFITGNRSCHSI